MLSSLHLGGGGRLILQMTDVFGATVPIIKGAVEKTGMASGALKPVGPSWPFNCAWNPPSSQSSQCLQKRRAQNFPSLPGFPWPQR